MFEFNSAPLVALRGFLPYQVAFVRRQVPSWPRLPKDMLS
jgi:hypothetical protein